MRSPRVLWTALAALVLGVAAARASERSELLVARGELAYHAGRVEEARARFAEALRDDPADETARGWLDVLAAGVPREPGRGDRPERAAKRWDAEVGTGVGYDSNVTLDPRDRREDAAFLFTLAGHVDPWRDDRTLVRLDYDFFQSVHADLRDFDVRANRFRATLSRAVLPSLWLGVQGGYDHTTLESHAYLQEPWVMPYLSLLESDRGSTQLFYRHAEQDFLGSPFDVPTLDRDGPLDAVGLNQLLFFFDHRLALTLGYRYEEATPHRASGDDFALASHQGLVGVRFPGWWRTTVEVDYVYRCDDYTEPNSAVGYRKTRLDDGQYLAAFLRRPILPHVDLLLSYYGTWNGSNVSLYDYQRHVVSTEVRVSF